MKEWGNEWKRDRERERERAGKQNGMNSIKPCSKSSALVQRFVNIFHVPISDFSHYISKRILPSSSKKLISNEIFSYSQKRVSRIIDFHVSNLRRQICVQQA